jgi:uncharacterized surface protein with fasciclin (FAS1) repeats
MKKTFLAIFCVAFLTVFSANAFAQEMGASTTKDKSAKKAAEGTIVDVAVGNNNFSTLVTAVQAAALVDTLKGKGPFTVFAPTNDAFGKLPAGTVETLVKPENKATLTKVLTYHVVAGKLKAKDVLAAIKKGNGTATLTTVQGGKLTAKLNGDKVELTDEKGGVSTVIMTDVKASNGIIHAIDTVVMPS